MMTTRTRPWLPRPGGLTAGHVLWPGPLRAGAFGSLGFKASAIAGIAGPVAFTGAWVVASLLQAGHAATEVQLSGLAAPDARDPWIMIAGFAALGGCSVAFGSALRRALGAGPRRAGPAPALIQAAGVLTIAAGMLRRDRMLLTPSVSESWHAHAHDLVSALIYLALVAATLLLARRFRGDPRWKALALPLAASGVATAAVLATFVSGTFESWDGVLQRIAVTVPLAAMCAVAAVLIASGPPEPARGAGPRRAAPSGYRF